MAEIDPAMVDGRRARRERGRLAVVDATVDLVQHGHGPPAVEVIADRAGVSVSSIFRYFESLEKLQQQTIDRFLERYAPLFEIAEIGVGPLEPRIVRYVGSRLILYETIAPIARLVRARALEQPTLAATLTQMRRRLVEQVRLHFAPELRGRRRGPREDLVGSIATLTSFEAWDVLRADLEVPTNHVRRAWTSGLRTLCTLPA